MNKITLSTPVGGTQPRNGTSGRADSARKDSSVAGDVVSTRDALSLTSTAQQLARAVEVQRDVPEVDSARVEQLKAAIQSGSYSISAERIARRMVALEKI